MPEGLSQEYFFGGVSIPRNRELMRVYRDLELVEQLGSGIPRILETYGRECFVFMDNFIRMVFPIAEGISTPHDTPHVEQLLAVFTGEHNRQELQDLLGLVDRKYFLEKYLNPAIYAGFVDLRDPSKPTSKNQRYLLTSLGKKLVNDKKSKR